MSLRVLFLDQSGQPGGAELCLVDIAEDLREGARVILFSEGPFQQILRERGVKVSVLATSPRLSTIGKSAGIGRYLAALPDLAGFQLALRKEIRDSDVVYLNTAKALLHGVAAGAGLHRPILFHLHDLLTSEHFSRLNIRLMTLAANRTQGVIANSTATAEAFRAAGGKVPVHVIPNGFDPVRFAPLTSAARIAVREEFRAGSAPVAAVFGRIARWKGQDLLLRAAAGIPGLRVWIVGSPFFTGDDHRYAEELKALASAPALAGRVDFLGHREDIPRLMQAADLIVHTSVAAEPFGRVVAEGMLSAKPVIASDSGGPREMIREAGTGWLFTPGAPEELAAKLKLVLSLPDRGLSIGLSAAQEARQKYSLATVREQTHRVLTGVMTQ